MKRIFTSDLLICFNFFEGFIHCTHINSVFCRIWSSQYTDKAQSSMLPNWCGQRICMTYDKGFGLSKWCIKNWHQKLISWLVLFIEFMGPANCAVVACCISAKKLQKWKESNCEIHGVLINSCVCIYNPH